MPTYVYDKAKGRCVLKSEASQEAQAPAARIEGDVRFISQRCEPELGKGTPYAAPYYVDGQPAFTSKAQAEKFGAAHGMVYAKDRPSPAEHRAELSKRSAERKAARQALRDSYSRQ